METETPTLEQLLEHSRAELDELAEAAGVENPARLPNKQAVAEAILAGGEPPAPLYTVHLAEGFHAVQFHVDQAEVELDDSNPTYSTTNHRFYLELLQLPFLHDPSAPTVESEGEVA